MMYKYLPSFFLLFLLNSVITTISGQTPENFTREDQAFITELELMVENLEKEEREKAQLITDTFKILWNAGFYNEEQKEIIYDRMDWILASKLRTYPDLTNYLNGVVGVINTHNKKENFISWHESFKRYSSSAQLSKLLDYWRKSGDLFRQNILFQSASVKWYLTKNNYTLSYTKDEIEVHFSSNSLVCRTMDDSTTLINTNGKVLFDKGLLKGNNGKITWERVNLDPEKVYAKLSDYEIELRVARFEADSVIFHNTSYFNEPLTGKLTERLLAEVKPEDDRYPRFTSYRSYLRIEDIFPDIDFEGGFTQMGQRVLGSSSETGEAKIHFFRNDSLFITAKGNAFSIRNDRIIAERAEVSIYLSGDSIYHPSIYMRYLDEIRQFALQRDIDGYSRAPFINTFHRIDMYCEAIYWKLNELNMELRMIQGMSEEGKAIFESHDFFSDIRYMKTQGISGLHPLIKLRNFANEWQGDTFPLNRYAAYVGGVPAGIEAQMLAFSYYGFISYDNENQIITLLPRLRHYIGAHVGRNDFDVINITSQAAINANINMNNFDLELFGVEKIPLSNEKNVVIHPFDEKLVMKKDRDMYFHGRIQSGLFDFYGKEFIFDYNAFKIDLVNTDSMSFRVRSFEADRHGNYSYERVRTVLEGINGELLVDHPRNKSGQKPYPRYPIFNSNNESFVYYDRENIHEGVYERDDVFFKLIPFSIDSLDNATTDNIAFDGVFVSTGIFPDFYDYLTVQRDYSLGFNTQTPADGYKVYEGKALYKGPIDMSYEGLRADGELEYLNSKIMAEEMLMFPDSASGKIHIFNITAQASPVEYPQVSAKNVDMLYMPHEDNMNISNKEELIEIFGGLAMLNGDIDMTPLGLLGNGNIEFFGGEIRANDLAFKQWDFETKDAYLEIMASDNEQVALQAQNYQAFVDVKTKLSNLSANGTNSNLSYPINRYDAGGFDFDWNMEDSTIVATSIMNEDIEQLGELTEEEWINHDFTGHELVSTHRAQDDLKFYAGETFYDLNENIIKADKVKIIKVADAAIYPDQEKVEILPRAEIKKLEQAVVLANTKTRLHRFYEAGITISTRWDYSGEGNYDYISFDGSAQQIHFNKIEVDRALKMTVASAYVKKEQDFTLNPHFAYQGEMKLEADQEEYKYDGATRIFVDCPNYRPNWVKFEAILGNDSIFIPLQEELANEANGRIYTSMMFGNDSLHPYPAVFDRKKHYSDLEMINATGYLTYDFNDRTYKITTREKFQNPMLADNIIIVDPQRCQIRGQGEIQLATDMGQFKISQFGEVIQNLNTNELTLDMVMEIDFFFINNGLAMLENSIRGSDTVQNLNLNRSKYRNYLTHQTGLETSIRLLEEYIQDGEFGRFPDELEHTLLLADVRMQWNPKYETFHNTGEIGVGNMDAFPINRNVDGYIEIEKKVSGDIFTLLLVPSDFADSGIGEEWYFLTYSNSIMQVMASDNEFNRMVTSLKPNRRRMDVERGEDAFSFIIASDRRPFIFMNTMQNYVKEVTKK